MLLIKAQSNKSFERTARQLASHQCCVVLSALRVAGGQPLNSGVSWHKEPLEVNLPEDNDRTEWDRVWRNQTVRQLPNPILIDVSPREEEAWGKVMRVEVVADPIQFSDRVWRKTENCPVCGLTTSTDQRMAVSIYPYFTNGMSYGFGAWAHEPCFVGCEEVGGSAPVPW